MTSRLNMTALITGASSGIGYALAKEFASHGYDVMLVTRSKDKLAHLALVTHVTSLSAYPGLMYRILTGDQSYVKGVVKRV